MVTIRCLTRVGLGRAEHMPGDVVETTPELAQHLIGLDAAVEVGNAGAAAADGAAAPAPAPPSAPEPAPAPTTGLRKTAGYCCETFARFR